MCFLRMQRVKEKGGTVSYSLKVDRERKATCLKQDPALVPI